MIPAGTENNSLRFKRFRSALCFRNDACNGTVAVHQKLRTRRIQKDGNIFFDKIIIEHFAYFPAALRILHIGDNVGCRRDTAGRFAAAGCI